MRFAVLTDILRYDRVGDWHKKGAPRRVPLIVSRYCEWNQPLPSNSG